MAENWLHRMREEHSELARQQYNKKVPPSKRMPEPEPERKETESDRMRAAADADPVIADMARQFTNVGHAAKAASKAFSNLPQTSRRFRISDQLLMENKEAMEKLQAQLMAMRARGELTSWRTWTEDNTFTTVVEVVGKQSACVALDQIITESFT